MARPTESIPTKTCASCGRRFEWRRKWARAWSQVRYCSERCRSRRGRSASGRDARIAAAIEGLLAAREGTICPSEAARVVWPEGWRGHMNEVRDVARRLAATGQVVWLQRGRPVDPQSARGAVRLGRGH